MNVLRTPKTLPGPELGIPALGFQAWYEARHGSAAYDAFARIPREAWAEYLAWYRRFLGIPVRYRTRLARIEPAQTGISGCISKPRAARAVETARKVILANGVAGNGGPYIPPVLSEGLPRALYAHTADAIDFAALRGKRVAVIGGAASAFDAAGGGAGGRGRVGASVRPPGEPRRDADLAGARAIPAPTTITATCPTMSAGTRRSASAAPARPRPPMRSSGSCVSRISVCTSPRRGSRRGGRRRRDRGAGGRRGIPFRFRDRRHRVFRRPAGPPGAGRFRRPNPAVARPLRAAAGRGGPVSRRASLSRGRARVSGKDAGRGAVSRATSMSTTRPGLSASAGPRATCRA